MPGLKSLKRRIAIAHFEREQVRLQQEVVQSRVLLGAYGLSHLDPR